MPIMGRLCAYGARGGTEISVPSAHFFFLLPNFAVNLKLL